MNVPADLLACYLLSDWTITVRDWDESSDGRLGSADTRVESREATIDLFAAGIEDAVRRFPNESRERVLVHELCEVAVAEECAGLPEHIAEHSEFMDFRDRMAERLRLCVARAKDRA